MTEDFNFCEPSIQFRYLIFSNTDPMPYSLQATSFQKVVHFTIEIKYGLVLLGAQPFSSLESLVSHFTSKGQLFYDSALILNNPVAPSNYVAPNRVRCKLPYTGAPDTDELTGS